MHKGKNLFGIAVTESSKSKNSTQFSSSLKSPQGIIFSSIEEIEELISKQNKIQVGLRNLLGVQHSNDWIYSLNIGNVMHLSPMNLDELHSKLEITHELNKDAMLEKVILISVSYFCYATEL